MSAGLLASVLFVVMLVLLAGGVWIAIALGLVGWVAIEFFTAAPAGSLLASTVWDSSWNWALTALPLFIWMGEILFRTRLSQDMFTGLSAWLGWLPGRLVHVNIIGCGIMAAVAGSSAVTCATVGRISLPELKKRGYDESLIIGTLAGSGTLGLLIPPSIMLIVYGVVSQQSISRLFMAGVLPGLLLIALFMGYVMLRAVLDPDKTPVETETLSLKEKLSRSRFLIPVLLLIVAILGSIYGGYATPTEAATVGVIGALILAAFSGSLDRHTLLETLLGATRTSCMITLILVAAAFLTMAMGFTGIPRHLAQWVETLELSPYALIAVLMVFYIILGCFLDGVSMLVLTATVVLPMVKDAGIDLIWFGIFAVIVVEMAQITPPVGFNLFVLQGMSGRDIVQVARASMPFFFLMILGIVIITIFPGIVTFLPQTMMR
ncbi:TRAP transporter large permease subunit [Aurantimonas sp. 22II-16-19i]|uniref:TRAP transporter large permease n=1 Tax=Aurantimonas sp. 22II-16-19i TaxID=1317114 RepID=UPI0009F7F2CF|nr:TRAP transporter large permease subunit [Aurantimonas sp. 22II-16-19i]ORE98964.1 TRAP dicarboxylate transporter subunit DctM [Aurantimonas sp. 22II-16-19i]